GDTRDLHSFPTRRSSDLLPIAAQPVLAVGSDASGATAFAPSVAACRRREIDGRWILGNARGSTVRIGLLASGIVGRAVRDELGIDRKSTRLNSSHVKISY